MYRDRTPLEIMARMTGIHNAQEARVRDMLAEVDDELLIRGAIELSRDELDPEQYPMRLLTLLAAQTLLREIRRRFEVEELESDAQDAS